jgi:hypothetical protein
MISDLSFCSTNIEVPLSADISLVCVQYLIYVHAKISIINENVKNSNKKVKDDIANIKETMSRDFLENIFLWGD